MIVSFFRQRIQTVYKRNQGVSSGAYYDFSLDGGTIIIWLEHISLIIHDISESNPIDAKVGWI